MNRKYQLTLSLLFLVSQVFSQDLVPAKAEIVGISTEKIKRIDAHLQSQLDKKWIGGAVAMVARKNKIIYTKAIGTNGVDKNDMKIDDIFRMASMTKPIVTTAMMILIEEGKCLLDEPISKYIPEFKNPTLIKSFEPKDSSYTTEAAGTEITIRQLLSHTSGIGYGFTDPKKMGAIYKKAGIPDGATMEPYLIGDKVKALGKLPLLYKPGTKWTYGLGIDVAGYLVEVISGKNLSEFCEEKILKPLEMNDTHFFYPESAEPRIVKIFTELPNGTVINASQFPQTKGLNWLTKGAKSYFSGGSGLSGTAADYMKFMQMIINGGTLNGKRVLSRKSIEAMGANHIGDLNINEKGTKFGLGFSVETASSSYHKLGSPGRMAWGGFWNTTFWIDPKEQVIAVLLTQIYPTTHNVDLMEKFENIIYGAIVD